MIVPARIVRVAPIIMRVAASTGVPARVARVVPSIVAVSAGVPARIVPVAAPIVRGPVIVRVIRHARP